MLSASMMTAPRSNGLGDWGEDLANLFAAGTKAFTGIYTTVNPITPPPANPLVYGPPAPTTQPTQPSPQGGTLVRYVGQPAAQPGAKDNTLIYAAIGLGLLALLAMRR